MTNDSFGGGSNDDDSEDRMTLDSQPNIPPTRLFRVQTGLVREILVDAHSVEISAHGDLLFFVFVIVQTPEGPRPSAQVRRGFAEGTWLDFEEQSVVASSSRIQ